MAHFLTSVGSGSQVTVGERRFAERLRDLLEDDYLCWFNVPIGPLHQYPDFVLLHPSHGLWVLEIKDWKIDTIRSLDKLKARILTSDGALKTVANPLEQARQYCMTVVNKLSSDPQLQQPSVLHQGKPCFPYAYAAVLTQITRNQLNAILSEEEQDLVLPSRLVICKDEMMENTPADTFQERLWGMFHHRFSSPLTLPQIDRVRWHLFPEIRITSVQQDFFSEASADESGPQFIRTMDLVQEQLARNLGNGHRVIHGVAGSGKTLILGYRCLHLAQHLHKPILILCYNITLAARLRSFIAERNLQAKVSVLHFHEWCKVQLKTYHAQMIESDKPAYDRYVESVIMGVEKGFIPRAQYGAIMIDEGHDFYPEWLKLITQMIDPETDSLLLLYDDAQSIYRNKSSIKFTLSSVGIKAQGRTTILRLNYRNTREILKFACDFASGFLRNIDTDEDHIPTVGPEAAGISGPSPRFHQFSKQTEEIDYAMECIRFWQREGKSLSEIAVLYFSPSQARNLLTRLDVEGIPALMMDTAPQKNAYDPRESKISIIPVPSSKGLEFDAVLVLGVGDWAEKDPEQNARLVYVAMTRARESLLLTSSTKGPIQQRLAEQSALLS